MKAHKISICGVLRVVFEVQMDEDGSGGVEFESGERFDSIPQRIDVEGVTYRMEGMQSYQKKDKEYATVTYLRDGVLCDPKDLRL